MILTQICMRPGSQIGVFSTIPVMGEDDLSDLSETVEIEESAFRLRFGEFLEVDPANAGTVNAVE